MKYLLIFSVTLLFIIPSFGQKVEILGDAKVTGNIEVMDTILFTDGSSLISACLQVLQDGDGDTKIDVEEMPDEDLIRFNVNGEEIAVFHDNRLEILSNGYSLFIGSYSGQSDDGTDNYATYIGHEAGRLTEDGFANTYIGAYAGGASSTSSNGKENTMIGTSAGFSSTGSKNTFIGRDAGRATGSGSENTYLGRSAGFNNTGSGNIFIGHLAGQNSIGSNKLFIHNDFSSDPLIYGEFDNELLRINGKLNINNAYDLPQVAGSAGQVLRYNGNGAMEWVNPNATTVLSDLDNDTKLELEQNPDEDRIRMTVGGYEAMYIDTVTGSGRLNINSWTFLQKPLTLYSSDISFSNLTTGEELGIKWGNPTIGFKMLYSAQGLGNNKVNLQYNQFSTVQDLMTWDDSGNVGVGTQMPARKLHVSTDTPTGHVMRIENTSSGTFASGLEILINRPTTGANNNFVTFKDADGIAGRIEGFNLGDGDGFNSYPNFDFSAYWNPISIEGIAFSPGSLPTISGGQLPSLNLTLPTLDYQWPTLSYSPPTLSGGIASFSVSAMANCVLSGGINCSNPLSWTPISWDDGNLTWNEGYANWNPGNFSWNSGSLPTISGGALPSFNIDAIIDPLPNVNAQINLKDVMCWALENGERSLITTNPWDLRMLASSSYLNNLADCKNGGVTYGSGGADYAEYLLREDYNEHIEEGQIVGVKGGKITKNTEGAEQLLVISMMPIVLGNMPDDTLTLDQYEKVAFLGQAPVWVIGKVRSGDYIIPSGRNDGYGMAVAPEELTIEHISKVVGRAWSDSDQPINLVNMVIGLKTNEMANIMTKTQKQVENLEDRIKQIEASLGLNELANNKIEEK